MHNNYEKYLFPAALLLLGFFLFLDACRPVVTTIIEPGAPLDTTIVDPGPTPTIIDSLVGEYYGTCFHVYRNEINGQLVFEYDTTYNSVFTIEKKSPTTISVEGCGIDSWLWGNWYFSIPLNPPADTIITYSTHAGSFFNDFTISFQDRVVTLVANQYSSGAYFESWRGEFGF